MRSLFFFSLSLLHNFFCTAKTKNAEINLRFPEFVRNASDPITPLYHCFSYLYGESAGHTFFFVCLAHILFALVVSRTYFEIKFQRVVRFQRFPAGHFLRRFKFTNISVCVFFFRTVICAFH